MWKILRLLLLIFSCGFYTLHISAGEIPGHPKSAEEIQDEQKRQKAKEDPMYDQSDDEQKKGMEDGSGGWAGPRKE